MKKATDITLRVETAASGAVSTVLRINGLFIKSWPLNRALPPVFQGLVEQALQAAHLDGELTRAADIRKLLGVSAPDLED